MSQKMRVVRGEFQGETALVQEENNDGTVSVLLVDFHTLKPIIDEAITIPKGDLENM